jgi:hypothetical protein
VREAGRSVKRGDQSVRGDLRVSVPPIAKPSFTSRSFEPALESGALVQVLAGILEGESRHARRTGGALAGAVAPAPAGRAQPPPARRRKG